MSPRFFNTDFSFQRLLTTFRCSIKQINQIKKIENNHHSSHSPCIHHKPCHSLLSILFQSKEHKKNNHLSIYFKKSITLPFTAAVYQPNHQKQALYYPKKPVLSIALDNSESVAYFKKNSLVQSFINKRSKSKFSSQ